MVLESDKSMNLYVLVAGLPVVDKPLQLAPGITICPLTCDLAIFDMAAVGAVGFQEWAVVGSLASQCVSEIESATDSAIVPGYDTLGRVWLASALLLLRGFDSHLCLAYNAYSWNLVAGRVASTTRPARYPHSEKLSKFAGGLLEFHLKFLNEGNNNKLLTKEDADWVNYYFNVFNELTAENDNFRLAVEAAVDWRYSKDHRSALARIWCGIEAICGISSELIYRVSLICSALLEYRGEKRLERFQNIKKLYNYRSKAVHGDKIPEEEMLNALFSSYHVLRDLILLIGEKGHVFTDKDFNEAIFF
jgi:hypothetical protein